MDIFLYYAWNNGEHTQLYHNEVLPAVEFMLDCEVAKTECQELDNEELRCINDDKNEDSEEEGTARDEETDLVWDKWDENCWIAESKVTDQQYMVRKVINLK